MLLTRAQQQIVASPPPPCRREVRTARRAADFCQAGEGNERSNGEGEGGLTEHTFDNDVVDDGFEELVDPHAGVSIRLGVVKGGCMEWGAKLGGW